MEVGIIGGGEHAAARERAASVLPGVRCTGLLDAVPLDAFLSQLDAVFVTVPAAEHFYIAEAATKQGVHVFLEWPPATSIRECEAMVRLSEEAGVEVGVSRPLRFHPVFDALPPSSPAALILLCHKIALDEDAAWPRRLADAVDLCCALAQSSSVQRIDAEAVRRVTAWPDALAFGLRFHNGTYAQVSLRRSQEPAACTLYAGGPGFQVEVDLDETRRRLPPARPSQENDPATGAYVTEPPIEAETQAFLQAVAAQRPVPVSILDGLNTMRLVERLMEKLR